MPTPPRIVQQRESNCRYDQIIRPEFLRSLRLWLRRCFQGSSQCQWRCFPKPSTQKCPEILQVVCYLFFWSPLLLYYFEKLLYRFKKEGISVIFFNTYSQHVLFSAWEENGNYILMHVYTFNLSWHQYIRRPPCSTWMLNREWIPESQANYWSKVYLCSFPYCESKIKTLTLLQKHCTILQQSGYEIVTKCFVRSCIVPILRSLFFHSCKAVLHI